MKRLLAIALILGILSVPMWAVAEQETVQDVPLDAISITTGLFSGKPDQILVVQMDNSPEARPQMGIGSADIVYEIELYNGGHTRYTAVFNDTIPETVEAVRSARIVNIDFYLEYGGAFVHFGGQQHEGSNIYEYVKKVDMQKRFDGLSDGANFYRDSARKAPYNAVARLQKIHESVDWGSLAVKSPLAFSETNYTTGETAVTEFSINYNGSYHPSYTYDAETGLYLRYYNGREYKDGKTGEQLKCANVIVQYMGYDWYGGESDRPKVTTTGTNKCEYFIDGTHFTGYWVRDSVGENTAYYDDAGNPVILKAGKTFIQTLKDTKEVTIAD